MSGFAVAGIAVGSVLTYLVMIGVFRTLMVPYFEGVRGYSKADAAAAAAAFGAFWPIFVPIVAGVMITMALARRRGCRQYVVALDDAKIVALERELEIGTQRQRERDCQDD